MNCGFFNKSVNASDDPENPYHKLPDQADQNKIKKGASKTGPSDIKMQEHRSPQILNAKRQPQNPVIQEESCGEKLVKQRSCETCGCVAACNCCPSSQFLKWTAGSTLFGAVVFAFAGYMSGGAAWAGYAAGAGGTVGFFTGGMASRRRGVPSENGLVENDPICLLAGCSELRTTTVVNKNDSGRGEVISTEGSCPLAPRFSI